MKRRKGVWMTLIIVILSVAMVFGTGITGVFASAPTIDQSVGQTNFYSKMTYGKEYAFDENTVITEPNGSNKTVGTDGKYTPMQVGAYTVSFGGYSYNTKCELDKEYELRVDYGGAAIPTYMSTKSGTGNATSFVMPAAGLYYKNEDGDFVKSETDKVYYKVGTDSAKEAKGDETENKQEFTDPGTYNVHYYATVNGGYKYLSQDFTVKVQSDFKDDVNPTLNVVNVPSEISLKTKITLPTATVTDDYDAGVKVAVSVKLFKNDTYDGNDVLEAIVDENGYGMVKEGAEKVVFDNKYNMSFYPLELGTYQITYRAIDDAGNESSPHQYTAKCIDKTAPVLKEIAEDLIPTKWGYSSVTNADKKLGGEELSVTFPYPEYVDNNDTSLAVSFEIKDTVNNKTVIRFKDIYDRSADGTSGDKAKYTAFVKGGSATDGLYGEDAEFKTDGFTFDFSKYVSMIKEEEGSDVSYTGTYTVTYQAQDSKPNISTKSFDITLEETLIDKDKPTAVVEFDTDYLLVTETEEAFTVPSLVASDAVDSRLKKDYKLISAGKELDVKGGESAKLVLKGTSPKPYLVLDDDNELELGSELTYSVTLTDDAGNTYSIPAADADADVKIPVLTPASFTAAPTFETEESKGTKFDTATDEYKEGQTVKVGKFAFKPADASLRNYTGFELTLLDGDGKVLQNTPISFETYYDGMTDTFHVDGIEFTPRKAQTYQLYIRIFDVTGKSVVWLYTCPVGEDPDHSGGITIKSGNIQPTGGIYTTYQLKNKSVSGVTDVNPDKQYIVRNITASGKFSVMDTQFTAYSAGDYLFKDGYYNTSDKFVSFAKDGSYKFSATQNETVSWEIQSQMPAYSGKGDTVTLPAVIANLGYENAKVTLTVSDPDDKNLSVAKDASDNEGKDVTISNNLYTFKTSKDGVYTVTYSAPNTSPVSYEIKSGDAVAPSFTVPAPASRAIENNYFKFDKVEVTSEEDNKPDVLAKTTFHKKLTDPTGSVVYEVDDKGSDGRDALTNSTDKDGYKFEKTGTYTVEYSVIDKAKNKSTVYYQINVSAKKTNNPVSTKIISTVLIIVGVLLIAGVILYFIRFRKVKSK